MLRKIKTFAAIVIAMFLLLHSSIVRAEDDIIARYQQAVVKIERDQIGETKDWFGSGVFYTPTKIITNAHVIGELPDYVPQFREVYSDTDLGRARFWVVFRGKKYQATFIGRDPTVDLAILEVEPPIPDVVPATLGDSNSVKIGDEVLVFGNPFGMENTVTNGIITAKEKVHGLLAYEDYFQTQAPINPGNSGGPLVSFRDGTIIGIVNSGISQANNMGYAIPVNIFKDIEKELRGTVRRAWIGINFPAIGKLKEAEGFQGLLSLHLLTGINDIEILEHIKQEVFTSGGVLITDVLRTLDEPYHDPLMSSLERNDLRTPAYKSGLKIGDIIKRFGNVDVFSSRDFMYALFRAKPYEQTTMRCVRFAKNNVKETVDIAIIPTIRVPESVRKKLY